MASPLATAPSPASALALAWQMPALVLLVPTAGPPAAHCGFMVARALTIGLEETCKSTMLVANEALSQEERGGPLCQWK